MRGRARTPTVPRPHLPVARDPPPSLEDLARLWRGALDASDAALRAARGSLPPSEIVARSRELGAERTATLALLEAAARERGASTAFLHLTPRRDLRTLLGLPAAVTACVFELDGVLVASAALHRAAWQQTFDGLLLDRVASMERHIAPFHPAIDYPQYIHGKPRLDGVVAFLESRGISLPFGAPADPPGAHTVHGLANRKNEALVSLIETQGVRSYGGSVAYLKTVVEAGLQTAVVSASANAERLLARADVASLIDHFVDGKAMVAQGLRRRPAPDVLLAACRGLGVAPQAAASFETTPAGVAAARAAGFAIVVAVNRAGCAAALQAEGADVVTSDLAELLMRQLGA